VLNGHSVVRLDSTGGAGNPDWLQIADHADLDIGTAAGKGFTAFFVVSADDNNQRFFVDKRGGDADYSIFNEGSSNKWLTGNGEQNLSPIASAGNFHIFAFDLDQTGAGSGTKNAWTDGVADDQNPQAYGNKEPDNDQPLYIGGQPTWVSSWKTLADGSGDFFSNMAITEVHSRECNSPTRGRE